MSNKLSDTSRRKREIQQKTWACERVLGKEEDWGKKLKKTEQTQWICERWKGRKEEYWGKQEKRGVGVESVVGRGCVNMWWGKLRREKRKEKKNDGTYDLWLGHVCWGKNNIKKNEKREKERGGFCCLNEISRVPARCAVYIVSRSMICGSH